MDKITGTILGDGLNADRAECRSPKMAVFGWNAKSVTGSEDFMPVGSRGKDRS